MGFVKRFAAESFCLVCLILGTVVPVQAENSLTLWYNTDAGTEFTNAKTARA